MRDLVQDFRYAARLLLHSPGFTFVAVAALALGIGANTAIFSVVDTLLLRPLPYADADRLAVVWEHNIPRDKKDNVVSPGNFILWRELNQSFKDLSAVSMTFRTTLTGAGDATELPMQLVSGSLFGMLGVRPALGRDFTPQEDAPGVGVVTISDRLWRQRFGADPSIVNRNITLNGRANLVVGVMPPGFSILDKLMRSFSMLLRVDPGFDASRTMTVKVSIPQTKYANAPQQQAFFNQLFERLDALPGVIAAGGTSFLPLNGLGSATSFEIVGKPKPPAGQDYVTDVRVITHDYFNAMGVPLVRGRAFDGRDAGTGVRRVIVNQALAQKHFPGEDPIGKSIIVSWNDAGPDEIVGVVGDVRQQDLETEARATIYWPPSRFTYPFMTIAIRTTGDPRTIVSPAIAALHDMDPNIAAADVRTMDEVIDISLAQRRLTMLLLSIFAGLALVLAAVGIYGVIGYSVSQRTQEIGIRMALGAPRGTVLRMVVGQAMWLAAIGVGAGAVGAWLLTRLMQKLLFGVTASDPLTFAAVSALLGLVAALAASVPGLRATRVDPVIALRSE